eukprot:4291186-Alexandrium_andersonii.AAC.1
MTGARGTASLRQNGALQSHACQSVQRRDAPRHAADTCGKQNSARATASAAQLCTAHLHPREVWVRATTGAQGAR